MENRKKWNDAVSIIDCQFATFLLVIQMANTMIHFDMNILVACAACGIKQSYIHNIAIRSEPDLSDSSPAIIRSVKSDTIRY